MTLTTRQYKLLLALMDSDDYVIISDLAENLNLSTRTVQRELSAISDFLEENGCRIEKKAGTGIRFLGSKEIREKLREDYASPASLRPVYSQSERVAAILTMLLQEADPRKIAVFSGMLGVSEATIGNDLNICEPWLDQSGIRLYRKQGAGVFLDATEWQRRQALVRLYYEFQDTADDIDYSLKHYLNNLPMLRNLVDFKAISKLRDMVDGIPQLSDVYTSDKSRSSLVIHLYTMYLRVKQGAGVEDRIRKPADNDATEILADLIIRNMEDSLSVSIPAGENEYLALLLKCSQGIGVLHSPDVERKAKRIAERMLRMAESATGVILDPTGVFSEALVKHLVPTIYRLKMGMEILAI